MKKIFWTSSLMIFLISCGGNPGNKQARLEDLKKQRDKLTVEITKLEEEINPQGNQPATVVKYMDVVKRPFEHYIEVQGRIDGNENIGVVPRNQGGVVTKIYVSQGDHVTAGQVLAELDNEVLKQSLKELQTSLDYATDMFNRQKNLWDQKIGSEAQYLTAKNSKESLEMRMNTLQDQIDMSKIVSPIDGTVEDIPIKVGQMASPASAQPCFRVVNFSRAKAVADVSEAYSAKIKTGDPVKVFLPDLNTEIKATITFSSKYINPTNRTFTVEAMLPPAPGLTFRANMIAVVRIKDYSNENSLAIPQNYIQSARDEGHFVFVAESKDGKTYARKHQVTPFISYNGLTEVLDGLKEGDKVITTGYKDLYDGQLISF
ncbi:MAG: efflux RND transporter periplasmic adaptor subunit [Bacteroidetes bacterium]|nr:MAG: efflux RND transporter periplasmic adaptor subunit [Bacteroidota bacterium]